MKIVAAAAVVFGGWGGAVCTPLYAQESLIGQYSGSYVVKRGRQNQSQREGFDLTIISIENGQVTGTAKIYGKHCFGDYLLAGTYKDKHLFLRSEQGGPAGDCTPRLRVVSEGNTLTGTMSQMPIELLKK